MNTKLGTESETGIAPKESGSEFRTLLRHDYLISSHSMTSSFLLRVLLLNLPCSSQSGQRYSSHIAIRINILLHLSIHSVTWLCGRGPDWLRHGSTAGKDVSVSFFFFSLSSQISLPFIYIIGQSINGHDRHALHLEVPSFQESAFVCNILKYCEIPVQSYN